MEYAKSLIKARALVPGTATPEIDDDVDIEESWTFIGDESDPEIQKKMQEWDLAGRGPPRVSMDGLRAMQGVEPVRKASTTKRGVSAL